MAAPTPKPNSYYATGRRKTSIARVWLDDGGKETAINGRSFETYFPNEILRMVIREPLEVTQTGERFGIRVHVKGGGLTGQACAVQLAIARALLRADQGLRPLLRKNGLLTRDRREKERKKFGHKKARRSFQYTKR
jgi:small subunit ribosomal protein S9